MPFKDPLAKRAYRRRWRAENPEKAAAARRRHRLREPAAGKKAHQDKWRAQNPEYMKAYRLEWERRNPTYQRERVLQKYGLTLEAYAAMLASQGGTCAICASPEPRGSTGKTFAVDHDHATGEVRGLLCSKCNTAIGLLRDDPALVSSALQYLTRKRSEAA